MDPSVDLAKMPIADDAADCGSTSIVAVMPTTSLRSGGT
jgi:hypothetical protein